MCPHATGNSQQCHSGFLDRAKPIVLAGGFWRPLVELMATDDPACTKYVTFTAEPREVADVLRKALRHEN
ncbi:MAG: hypothetical protein FJ280_03425 [Planctomycetes bacterium]|nr:hypothetical protein [Planctomycetota bacterium]